MRVHEILNETNLRTELSSDGVSKGTCSSIQTHEEIKKNKIDEEPFYSNHC